VVHVEVEVEGMAKVAPLRPEKTVESA